MRDIKTLTNEEVLMLRREIVLNSLFTADYHNSLEIAPVEASCFFDGFLDSCAEDYKERHGHGVVNIDDYHEFLAEYDTPEQLLEYFNNKEW